MDLDRIRPWKKVRTARWLVPLFVVVVLTGAIGVVATTRGDDARLGRHLPTNAELKALARDPRLPVTYDEARQAGTVDRYDWGNRCDPGDPNSRNPDLKRSRVKVPSVYSPPCVPAWGGSKPWVDRGGQVVKDNGGATTRGVTATTITIAFYLPAAQDIAAQLNAFGVVDTPEVTYRGVRDLVRLYSTTYELYGRKVLLKPFSATGDGRNPALARADARKVAEDMHAFASIGGPTQTQAYEDELARRGVLCFNCGYATTDQQYRADAPYAWGHLATPDQLLQGILQFGAQSVAGHRARFAGDPQMRQRQRVFGVVHYEQDPPVFGPLEAASVKKFAKLGGAAKIIRTYLLDLNSLAGQARDIIGELKRAGVTTVVFLGDPLMPKFLTEQAAAQDYHPEWTITGTVFTDTTAVGRLYDQQEWSQAFGASSGASRVAPQDSDAWRVFRWFYGRDPEARKTMLIWGPVVQEMFVGLQGAGPRLDEKTFAGAMFRYPPTPDKGSPVNPKISYGFHLFPGTPDFAGVDDFSVVWWDPNREGPDESARVGQGMWQYVFRGQRISLADANIPVDVLRIIGINDPEDLLFAPKTSVTITKPEPNEAPPSYPAFPGSPAAKGG